jgi:calcium-dependent protein kinase
MMSALNSRRSGAALSIQTKAEKTKAQIQVVRRIERLPEPFLNLYTVEGEIHDGGEQCRIKKVKSKVDKKDYVTKIQLKSRIRGRNEALFRRMTERMMNLPENEHVVKVHACMEDDKYFYTFLEACQGGDLFDFFKMLTSDNMEPKELENEVRTVVREMLVSLNHLHKQGLVHKDVKLENLVFKEKGGASLRSEKSPKKSPRRGSRDASSPKTPKSPKSPTSPSNLKLIDFDFLDEWEPSSPKTKAVLGTDGYIAPEAYLGDACPKSDVFATGVVMYVLIAGRFPYNDAIFDDGPNENFVGGPKMQQIYDKMASYKVRFGSAWEKLPEAAAFCQQLLAFDMSKRLDSEQALQHPWLNAAVKGA